MSELSQPKKPVGDEDTLVDSAPVVAKAASARASDADAADGRPSKKTASGSAANDRATKDGAAKDLATKDLDKTDPDHSAAAPAAEAKASSDATEPAPKASEESPSPAETKDESAETKDESAAEAKAEEPKTAGPITLRVFGRTDVGQVREHNEDNFVVADLTKASRGLMEHDRTQTVGDRGTVLGVCDGMGGAAAGEVASQLAVDIVYQRMLSGDAPTSRDDLATRLVSAIETAGMRIFSEAKADRSRRGMGTTATIAAMIDDHLFFGQVGDSRGYLLRGDRLVQVTRDQSLVNQLIEAGQLTEEEAETFEHNNIILQALGTADSVQVDLTYVDLRRGDTVLLCSDGLSGMVRNDEIREVLRTFDDPLEACRELTDRANLAGGHDNVTVVVAKFEGDGLKEASSDDIAGLKYRKYELPELASRNGDTAPGQNIRTSMRPGKPNSLTPDIEVGYDEYDSEYPDSEGYRPEDPVELPREQAPSWIVTMMIVSAVTCVVVAGYYLLR
ncbi:MAG: Stp1/IreP family PP2C-type Ser/Thr phosphatase [Polyangiaceae bacterium]|nr:Stp1/IreP family PP2C-type Ser/Thr phosphatase [Polyangiaceae bacterium]